MSKYREHLRSSLVATFAGLPIGCVAGGLLVGLYGMLLENGSWSSPPEAFGFGLTVAWVALFIGILPSFAYGAPAYALISQRGAANIWTAAAIGSLPALAFLAVEPSLAALFLVFGVCVAVSTHLLAKRRLAKFSDHGR
jgi:hypothetical protein